MIFSSSRKFVFFAVPKTGTHSVDLFIDESKITGIKDYLEQKCKVKLHPYEKICEFLSSMESRTVTIDAKTCNFMVYNALKKGDHKIRASECNLIQNLKAKKNPTMIEGMKAANIRDCAGIVKYFAWLEE